MEQPTLSHRLRLPLTHRRSCWISFLEKNSSTPSSTRALSPFPSCGKAGGTWWIPPSRGQGSGLSTTVTFPHLPCRTVCLRQLQDRGAGATLGGR